MNVRCSEDSNLNPISIQQMAFSRIFRSRHNNLSMTRAAQKLALRWRSAVQKIAVLMQCLFKKWRFGLDQAVQNMTALVQAAQNPALCKDLLPRRQQL
jgi:hypothetical protein